jgi:hypothetical protein
LATPGRFNPTPSSRVFFKFYLIFCLLETTGSEELADAGWICNMPQSLLLAAVGIASAGIAGIEIERPSAEC